MQLFGIGRALAQAGLKLKWSGSSLSVALRLPELSLPPTSFPNGLMPALVAPGCGQVAATPAPPEDALAWDGLLKGVQKQKSSYHAKRVRNSANSKLKQTVALVHCQGCGRPKLRHHICEFCFAQINRWQKLEFGRSNKDRDTLLAQMGQLPIDPSTGKPQLSKSNPHSNEAHEKLEAPDTTPPRQ